MTPRRRKRRCLNCGRFFDTNYRCKQKHRHCSDADCQRKRRNANIRDWYHRNPESLEYQKGRVRQWFKDHPGYSRERRKNDPSLMGKNRLQSKIGMRRIRNRKLFDKTNSFLSQLNGNQEDKCYLTEDRRWLICGLTKQTRLLSSKILWENHPPALVALPKIKTGYLLPVPAKGP